MILTNLYWLRWTQESDLQYPLLPAVLTAGDKYGITPTEFPILTLLTAPLFGLGVEWGRVVAQLFIFFF